MPRSDEDRRFPYYPAFLDLRHRHVVVIGGGEIATVKVQGILPGGPEPLEVIAPEVSPFIQSAAADGKLRWLARPYRDGDLAGADLVFAATDDRAMNATVAAEARQRGILVLAVDDVPNCDFIAPSLVKRGDVIIAISTGGRSPAFARWAREHLDRDVPAYWGDLLDAAATTREKLGPERRRVPPDQWQIALDEAAEHLAALGDLTTTTDRMLQDLRPAPRRAAEEPPKGDEPRGSASDEPASRHDTSVNAMTSPTGLATDRSSIDVPFEFGQSRATGFVSLVGAGPGDPELLTLRGLRRLEQADAVVHDRLICAELLDYCRADAERYDVGKASGRHTCRQEDINDLLVRLGRAGKRVVRLKGGDPFVFGRGGEEALALEAADIPFEIVPGVSSAIAVPASAGIPVTHRGVAASVTIATGHPRTDGSPDDHDWASLARLRGTLVFLMAVENLDHIVDRLLDNGRSGDEPSAMIQSGTTSKQRSVFAPLRDIVRAAREAEIRPPAVLVVGATVELAQQIGCHSPLVLG